MPDWNADDLNAIAWSDDLRISPFRDDEKTYGTPTWIWSVVVDGELYVRAYNGTGSRWYRSAMSQRAGRINAAGATREVAFEPIGDAALNDAIDAAYRAKYSASQYLVPMISARTRAATVRIRPA